jgi:hypothetical protein
MKHVDPYLVGRPTFSQRDEVIFFICMPFSNMNLLTSLHSIFQDEEILRWEEEVEVVGLEEDLDDAGLEDPSDNGGHDSEEEEDEDEEEECDIPPLSGDGQS